jgi:hypothetical protein
VALVPPRPSVLPPGAGNEEPEKAVKAGKERAKKIEQGYAAAVEIAQGHGHATAIRRHDDGDPTITALEEVQAIRLPCSRRRRVRAV